MAVPLFTLNTAWIGQKGRERSLSTGLSSADKRSLMYEPAPVGPPQSVESEGSGYMFVTGSTQHRSRLVNNRRVKLARSYGVNDEIMIEYSGSITLIGNTFFNWRTGTSVPRIKTAAFFDVSQPSTLFSQGNWYMNAPAGFPPILGSGDKSVWTMAHDNLSVTSLGDYGGFPREHCSGSKISCRSQTWLILREPKLLIRQRRGPMQDDFIFVTMAMEKPRSS